MTTQRTKPPVRPSDAVRTPAGSLQALGGLKSDEFNSALANQVFQALWLSNDEEGRTCCEWACHDIG
jgi:hypothetical protein